jgi:hypothetical protein
MKYDKRTCSTTIEEEGRLSDVRGEEVTRGNRKWFIGGDVSKMTVYRPTVRYASIFRDYVNAVFHATTLDRNQIIRAALFTAAHTKEFHDMLKQYQKKDVPLPRPKWGLSDHQFWLEQSPEMVKGGEDVNVDSIRNREVANDSRNIERRFDVPSTTDRGIPSITRREGEVPTKRFQQTGGIVIRIE